MWFSKKADYAMRALVSLARCGDARPVPIRALAQINDVSQGFMQQIMLDLKEQGWVQSVSGRDGGYQLADTASTLTMAQVVRHFDGPLAPAGCVSVTRYEPCTQESSCAFRRVLLDIRNYSVELLDKTTLAELAADHVPCGKTDVPEFTGGAGI